MVITIPSKKTGISLNSASILVVDDDEMIVYFFKTILEEIGYEVIGAYNGTEALERARERKIDLAILDYRLADLKGDVLARKIKEENKETKIIFVTGYNEIAERILADKLASIVIVKPIRDDKLVEIVEQALHESELWWRTRRQSN